MSPALRHLDLPPLPAFLLRWARRIGLAIAGLLALLLVGELAAAVAAKSHTAPLIFIKADKETRHGRIVKVMDAVKRAGAAKIAVAVEPKG